LFPAVQKRLSPIIGALIAGVCTLAFTGRTPALEHVTFATSLARPQFYAPVFSWGAAFELVLPLAVTVIAVQNAQGIAVLRNSLHRPPVNAITNACGVFSALTACLGCVSTCLAGPSNAIIASGANASRHWLAAVFLGVMVIVFGLFSPLVTQALLATPAAFVATLAGLALLRILQGAFHTAFRQHFTLGALVAFLVTLGGLPLLGIGAPFWGVVFGVATSFILERGDFAKQSAA
jgi:benzoate membrane transport protein